MQVPPISATELVDESGRPLYERERALEAAFLAIRASRAAQAVLDKGVPERGAVALFPVVCFSTFEKSSGCGAAGQRALEIDHEPGEVFDVGVTRVAWAFSVGNVRFMGAFFISVGNEPAPQATCVAALGKERVEVPSPFSSVVLPVMDRRSLTLTLRRVAAGEGDGLAAVMKLSEGMVRAVMRRLAPRFQGVMDTDDARQEAYRAAISMARRFGSPNRQKASWGRVFMLGVTQAVERAANQLTGMGRPEIAMRRLIESNPGMATAPIDVVRAELEKRIAEASSWSDERIEQARNGPPILVADTYLTSSSTAIERADTITDGQGERSMGELLRTLLPDEESRRAALPYLVDEGWVPGNRGALDKRAVAKAKTVFFESVAKALAAESGTKRGIIEMFAQDGERYDRPEDRAAMTERARAAVGAILSGAT